MAHHSWGDGFDFDRLNAAGCQIANIFKALTGQHIIWKEKYGTLRFECQHAWLYPEKEGIEKRTVACVWGTYEEPVDEENSRHNYTEDFMFAVHLTVCDYPDMAEEILSDFLFHDKWDEINKHRLNRKPEIQEDGP